LAKHFESVLDFQNTFESVLLWQNTFEIYLLGQFISIGEKLFQRYTLKSFFVIGDCKKIWNRAKIFFLCALSIAPPFFPQSSVFLVSLAAIHFIEGKIQVLREAKPPPL
jgi:hypothetical protein